MSLPRRRRFALILLVIIAAAACLALGWWQWTRYESASGGFQNLGYALQWPLFAFFCVYAYRKFVRFEESAADETPADPAPVPDGLVPARPAAAPSPTDAVLTEYNAYLAELADNDKGTHR